MPLVRPLQANGRVAAWRLVRWESGDISAELLARILLALEEIIANCWQGCIWAFFATSADSTGT